MLSQYRIGLRRLGVKTAYRQGTHMRKLCRFANVRVSNCDKRSLDCREEKLILELHLRGR